MNNYFHPDCLFQTFERARATTKVLDSIGDLEGLKSFDDFG
jgi:hypothetical protein